MRSMKSNSVFVRLACAISLLIATHAMAAGLKERGSAKEGGAGVHGGGDICEDRIQQIRDDLKSWIDQGGAQSLALPQSIPADRYAELMLNQLKSARVKCVSAGDTGYPVTIGNTPKVCKFSIDQTGSQITCDYVKFLATGESDQYVLIHHEYAGLAGVELPDQNVSRYEISNQISAHLEEQIVKKLAVKPIAFELKLGSRVVIDDNQFETKSARIIGVISEKYTYYQVRVCSDSGQLCEEQVMASDLIKGSEIAVLNGVTRGQKAVCKNIHDTSGGTFEGKVAHIYSNGFVEIEIPTGKVTSGNSNPEFYEGPIYWSSVPGTQEAPLFGYACSYHTKKPKR